MKTILLINLKSKIQTSGFNKKFQEDDFVEIIKISGFDVNDSRIELLQRWSKCLERVRDLPLKTRQDYAIKELIETGISREDAIDVVQKIAKMVVETSKGKEEEINVEQKTLIEEEIYQESRKHEIDKDLLFDEIIEDVENPLANHPTVQTKRESTISSSLTKTKDPLQITYEKVNNDFEKPLKKNELPQKNLMTELESDPSGSQESLRVIPAITKTNQETPDNPILSTQNNSEPHRKRIVGVLGLAVIILFFFIAPIYVNNLIINNTKTNAAPVLPQIQNTNTSTPKNTSIVRTPSITSIISNDINKVHTEIVVQANEGWQNTNILLSKGQQLTITYQSGRWAPYLNIFDLPYTSNPKEYPGSILSSASAWSLIGKVGNGVLFDVNRQINFVVENSGYLQLRINDDDYLDNTGSIIIKIDVEQGALENSSISSTQSNTVVKTKIPSTKTGSIISEKTMDVSSRVNWVSTKIDVLAGDRVVVEQISGKWTVDPRNFDMVDGNGYLGLKPRELCDFCSAPIYEGTLGQLVAKVIGSTEVYAISKNGEFVAPVDGLLCLMINDLYQSFGDNEGDLNVKITVFR